MKVKVAERGQVTIPTPLRPRLGIRCVVGAGRETTKPAP